MEWCRSIGLELMVVNSKEVYKILEIQKEKQGLKHLPCSICSRMKKAAINKVANEIGFNKVAFAHHADDAIETLVMNEIHGCRIATFSPKMHLEKADITFIRPLITTHENDIKKLVKEENLPVFDSHCPADKTTTREDVKQLMDTIYKEYPQARDNFLTMLSNYEQEDLWGEDISYQLNANGLVLKPVITVYQMAEMTNIRYQCFVEEYGISFADEIDLATEKEAHSYLICQNNIVVGCIRYRPYEDGYKVERVAILKEYRHQGIAKAAINFVSDMIRAKYNPCTIYIHSMSNVLPLYLACGYQVTGEEFLEAGIKHFPLEKKY